MKKSKKMVALVMALCMGTSLIAPASATGADNGLKEGISEVITEVSALLENNPTKQTIVVSEQQLIDQMLKDAVITREDLNIEMNELADKPKEELQQIGYNEQQIEIISSYECGEDAYNHIFSAENVTRSNADLVFSYGLAGQNTKRDITIAYDIRWTACPFWTFTDSFGIGWIAADSQSHEVITKIDSSEATVQYYTPSGENAHLYRDIEMNDFSNCVVIGNFLLGSAQGNYGQRIGGTTKISSQSGSYNIDTIQIFVAYGHTTLSIGIDLDVSLSFDLSESGISFGPSVEVNQEIMAQGHHTFKYNAQGEVVA